MTDSNPKKKQEFVMAGLNSKAKVKFRGEQYRDLLIRVQAGLHVGLLGIPGTGKTMIAKMALLALNKKVPEKLTHDQLDEMFKKLIESGRIYTCLGKQTTLPGEIIGTYVKVSEIFCGDCRWKSVVYEDEDHGDTCPKCKSPGLSKTDSGLTWRWGPLARAMMEGKPFFFNELTRAPAKTQDVMIAPMSEGYLPVDDLGRTIFAKEGFVAIMDMNTVDHDPNVEAYCWALGRRFRKIWFPEANEEVVKNILNDRLSKGSDALIAAIVTVFNETTSMYHHGELERPMLPSGTLDWAADFALEMESGTPARKAFVKSAELTWLPDVVTPGPGQERILQIIDATAQTFRFDGGKVTLVEDEMKFMYHIIVHTLNVSHLPYDTFKALLEHSGVTDYSLLWTLLDPSIDLNKIGGLGKRSVVKIASVLSATVEAAGIEQDDDGFWTSGSKPDHWSEPYRLGKMLQVFVAGMPSDDDEDNENVLWDGDLTDLMNRGIKRFSDLAAMGESDLKDWVEQNEYRKPLLEWHKANFDKLQNLANSNVLL